MSQNSSFRRVLGQALLSLVAIGVVSLTDTTVTSAQQALGTPLSTQQPAAAVQPASESEDRVEVLPTPEPDPAATKTATETAADTETDVVPESALVIPNAQLSLIQNAFIATPLPGVVSEVNVREGDRVKKDDVLLVLDSEQAMSELTAARAALRAARLRSENDVDRRYAQRTLAVRKTELLQSHEANEIYSGAVSDNEVQQLTLEVDQATLAIEQADHELEVAMADAIEKEAAVKIAETKVKQHTLRTTVGGLITQVDTEPGEWAEPGKPVVRIISLDPIRAECFIDGREQGTNLVGRSVRFTVPAGMRSSSDELVLTGKVVYVSPEIHPVTGQTRLWATLDNPGEKASVGMLGSLSIGQN
ncbi:HlyD family efflux transporter periplasmic adaptor subunit [Stieleria varia]|uniref:Multidrug resistance protein MdtN n=1 Tax=Stieleria varia TaxID=2528005 RepID=A0A5C6B986_9BACT|nr:HlyD family efflux transporter periplasmic adaptor subunit [Stieleria varia]TWU08202.1 multidrug resistance protein MdtN [Stieleria varia]